MGVELLSLPTLVLTLRSAPKSAAAVGDQGTGMDATQCGHRMASFPVDASCRRFDVPTIFGSDVAICKALASEWYRNMLPDVKSLPPKIIHPVDYMSVITKNDQLCIVDQFVVNIEAAM